jgi:hypothetical protein
MAQLAPRSKILIEKLVVKSELHYFELLVVDDDVEL